VLTSTSSLNQQFANLTTAGTPDPYSKAAGGASKTPNATAMNPYNPIAPAAGPSRALAQNNRNRTRNQTRTPPSPKANRALQPPRRGQPVSRPASQTRGTSAVGKTLTSRLDRARDRLRRTRLGVRLGGLLGTSTNAPVQNVANRLSSMNCTRRP
jgi:hypothetical protein